MPEINPQDAEDLEFLELMAKTSAEELESLKEKSFELTLKIITVQTAHEDWVSRRDTLKAALEGMGCKTK